MEAGDGIHILDRGIGPVADDRSCLHQFLPDVSSLFGSLFSQPLDHPGAVRGAVDGLHRGNHTYLAEAGDVIGMEMLGMFDTPAEIFYFRMGLEGLLEDIQGFLVAPVADGVDTQLEIILDSDPGGFFEVFDGACVQAHARR